MKITASLLREHRACADQRALFKRTFPDGMDVDEETLLRAAEVGLDLDWAAVTFLPLPLLTEYKRQRTLLWAERAPHRQPFLAEYHRQLAPLRAEYDRQCVPLDARQRDLLWVEYDRQRDLLWADYERKGALQLTDYDRQCALVLAKLVKDLP